MNEALRNKLFSKVSVSDSGCWNWTGGKSPSGYGVITVNGKTMSTHRLSYALTNGDIPAGMLVMHSCDNPSCINPKHLSAGTQKDNMQDASIRGRCNRPMGEDSAKSKYSEDQVIEAMRMLAEGKTKKQVCEIFGMALSTLTKIRAGSLWPHLVDRVAAMFSADQSMDCMTMSRK